MKNKNLIRACMTSAVIAMTIFSTAPADAIAYNISGQLNTGGHLVQYPTFRDHTAGSASLELTKNVSTVSRFGLRNSRNDQVTRTLQYNSPSWQSWGHVPNGRYALNGRMEAQRGAVNSWNGVLVL